MQAPMLHGPTSWDNDGTHKMPWVPRRLARHRRFPVHFTPTGASWLNLVERWFATRPSENG
jgi:hypothetical protein